MTTENSKRMADRIEVWPTDKLVPYDKNPRTHSAEQVNQIAASIAEFGFLNPILVDTTAGIIAGHGRLQAAKQLGLAQVPVVVLDHLTDAQKRAYVIADNKLALNAGWDEDLLRAEMTALEAEDFDLPVIGFSDDELAALLAEPNVAEGQTDEDAVPEAPETPVSKPGDLWRLGNHLLLCGDSTVLANVERVLDGALADMVFTDPPYNVDYGNSAKDKMRGTNRTIMNDNLGDGFEKFLYDTCVNMLTVCKGALYARHRGVSHVAVLKAIKAGRIEKEPDGTIDPTKADAAWERNTNQAQKRKATKPSDPSRHDGDADPPVGPPIVNSGPSFAQSRAIKEAYNARLAKLAYEEKSGALVKTDSVKVAWFNTLRVVRDRALNLPDRLAPLLATESDPKIVRDLLEEELRIILNDAANAIANLQIG